MVLPIPTSHASTLARRISELKIYQQILLLSFVWFGLFLFHLLSDFCDGTCEDEGETSSFYIPYCWFELSFSVWNLLTRLTLLLYPILIYWKSATYQFCIYYLSCMLLIEVALICLMSVNRFHLCNDFSLVSIGTIVLLSIQFILYLRAYLNLLYQIRTFEENSINNEYDRLG